MVCSLTSFSSNCNMFSAVDNGDVHCLAFWPLPSQVEWFEQDVGGQLRLLYFCRMIRTRLLVQALKWQELCAPVCIQKVTDTMSIDFRSIVESIVE